MEFAAGQDAWRAGLGTLRQVVRQELVARQLATRLPDTPPRRILDVGCGQGTQLLRLARRGHLVTGLDSSATMLDDLARDLAGEPEEVRARVRTVRADAAETARIFPAGGFDAVLCHGVLMYLDDPGPLLAVLARTVRHGGVPAPEGLVDLLACEERAGATDPYRRVAALTHVLAERVS